MSQDMLPMCGVEEAEKLCNRALKRTVDIELVGVELYSVVDLLVYEMHLKVTTKGWQKTGEARYRHFTNKRLFKFQISLEDAHILGFWMDRCTDLPLIPGKTQPTSSFDSHLDSQTEKGIEEVLQQLVMLG